MRYAPHTIYSTCRGILSRGCSIDSTTLLAQGQARRTTHGIPSPERRCVFFKHDGTTTAILQQVWHTPDTVHLTWCTWGLWLFPRTTWWWWWCLLLRNLWLLLLLWWRWWWLLWEFLWRLLSLDQHLIAGQQLAQGLNPLLFVVEDGLLWRRRLVIERIDLLHGLLLFAR